MGKYDISTRMNDPGEMPPEFNQMQLYLERLDRRNDERDRALNGGTVKEFYLSTMSILLNTVPRCKQKGLSEEEADKIKDKLVNEIGKKIKSLENMKNNAKLYEQNSLIILEELFNYNLKLNDMQFIYGLIFPIKESRDLKEIIAEDF